MWLVLGGIIGATAAVRIISMREEPLTHGALTDKFNEGYDRGHAEGYGEGHSKGHKEGDTEGWTAGQKFERDATRAVRSAAGVKAANTRRENRNAATD